MTGDRHTISAVALEDTDVVLPARIAGLVVETVQGQTSLHGADAIHMRYQTCPHPGESLGASGSIASGASGLYVEDDAGKVYGITAGHVIASSVHVVSPFDADYARR